MKRLLLAVPVLIVTLIAVALIAPNFIDWGQYKLQAQTQIKKISGLDVAMNGDLGLAILPSPRFYANDVVVKAPAGSKQENLATAARMDVRVALMPLFAGDVVVSAVELVRPQIAIEVFKDGRQNWQTPEIEALRAAGDHIPADQQPARENRLMQSVSLDHVKIEDGAFVLIDDKSGKTTSVENINLDVKAETLQGPFDLKGDVAYTGQKVAFEAQAGKIEPGAKSVSLKGKADISERGLNIDYAGVVALGGPFEIQGETAVKAAPLSASAPGVKLDPDAVTIKGILTASAAKFSYQNLVITAGGQKITGALTGTVSPLSIKGDLQGSDVVDLDKFLPSPSGGKAGFDPAKPGAFLPETLNVPAGFDIDVTIALPGMIYKKQVYSDVAIGLGKKGNDLKVAFAAGEIPGKGNAEGQVDLKFAASAAAKDGKSTVLSNPTMLLTLKGRTQNAAQTLQAVSGQEPQTALMKPLQFDIGAAIQPNRLQVSESTVTLDEKPYKVSGTMENRRVDATIGALGGELNVKGSLDGTSLQDMQIRARHPNLATAIQTFSGSKQRNAVLEKPVDFSAKIDQDGKVYKLADINATLGGDTMSGSATYDTGAAKPTLTGTFRFGDLVLQSVAGGGKGGAKVGQGAARWSTQAIDTGWMHSVNADLDIAAKSIKYETWDLTNPLIKLSLKDGAMDITQMETGLYGGTASVTGTLNGTGGPLAVKAKTTLKDVSVEQLVKSFVGNQIVSGAGQASVNAEISTSGASQAAMIAALQGQGSLSGKDIVLEGFDLTRFARALSEESKPGDTVLGLWKGTTKGGSTAFDTMDGAFTLTNGVANISKLDMDGPKATLTTTGNINLPQWTIATAHNITLKERKDVPPFAIKISGPLDNPAQTFVEGAIKDYFQRKATRKLEKILSDKLGLPAAPQQQATPDQVTPGGGDAAPSDAQLQAPPTQQEPQQQEQKPVTPEDAFRGLLQGIIEAQ